MKVLSTKKYESIITWTPSGKAFSIVEPRAFVSTVLPEEFKSAKYASFTRKLHRWGFLRHYRGEEAGAFYHDLFQRDNPQLVDKMTCYKPESQSQSSVKGVRKELTKQKPAAKATMSPPKQMMASAFAAVRPPFPMQQLGQQPMSMSDSLNMAIEIEVSRRLQERMQAAALTRQNLALLNQSSLAMPWTPINGNLQAQLLLKLKDREEQAASLLEKTPSTNIRGAKTA